MSTFTSTRGSDPVPSSEAVLRGLAPDGGLYVPVEIPVLPPISFEALTGEGSDETVRGQVVRVAHWAAPVLFPDVPGATVARVVERALTFPIPLVEVEPGRFVLELFHGPTHAFKDVGARFMAALMVELGVGETRSRTILVATSGDTGGAVADAFHGLEGYRVVVLFPREGVSVRQRRQMTTLGGNVHALAVRGTFDDCQRMVKDAFLDTSLGERYGLTSANSINIARLLPQTLYFAYAAICVARRVADRGGGVDADSVRPRFVVPSGNLGNLCAGLLAQRAGMASSGFIAASNTNRAFVDFLAGDGYEPRPSISTASNAMDVGAPSNLERILWLYDDDAGALRRDVVGVSVTDDQTTRCIAEVYERTGYVLDPHSAVAFAASRRHDVASDKPAVILATAHPAKFPEIVEAAIGREIPLPPGLARTPSKSEHMHEIEATLPALSIELEALPT